MMEFIKSIRLSHIKADAFINTYIFSSPVDRAVSRLTIMCQCTFAVGIITYNKKEICLMNHIKYTGKGIGVAILDTGE